MNKTIVIVLGIIIIVGVALYVFSGQKTEQSEMVHNVPEVQNETPKNEVQKVEPTTEVMAKTDAVSTTAPGSYEAFAPEKIAMAAKGKVILFFHASWCPSCRGLNSDIEKNVNGIPSGVTILKTNYDKETELKKKYGVTSQHTLVQVDKDGNLIKKWSGGSRLENLLAQIQ
ncbi:thioredoxin family protein [Candidatus Kaiserbacteria bacterium]|nr:thioredoxin family protein [Candidatus Kaiserbacteria bacterium]